MGLIVLYKGWFIYWQAFDNIRLHEITRADNEHVFLLESWHDLEIGSVLEVHRTQESVEIPIGLIKATLRRDDGKVQTKPLGIMPTHLRDLEKRELSVQSLSVCRTLGNDTLTRWIEIRAKEKVDELMRRGGKG